ncbi:CaiB/BaiF CoA transferase family protein [Sphingomonas panacis]|uniref:CaiB/BaiF CoA transferase family protein n=1 Tax=Sphingomonas panacis TaxID=1560345 RepID=UPI000AA8AF87|nr:CaiB/BaiF CoA-transferase family protein [Sphingomonas panacis]
MNTSSSAAGPLAGLRVLEFSGIGPAPYCAMLLSDLGAEVLRVDRPGDAWRNPILYRGRSTSYLDLRSEEGLEFCLQAADHADVVIEGFRPGVMERLGLGPEVLMGRNPRLIYGRMTGWGQDGPLAQSAGHDINYLAITGALHAIGVPDRPAIPPLNLLGDFGGGSLFLALGILAAVHERSTSGRGQIIDAAIVDGVSSLLAMFKGLQDAGRLSMDRGRNVLGGAAPFYRCYTCADGREIAVGSIEPQFYRELLVRIGAPDRFLAEQHDDTQWNEQARQLAEIFETKPAQEWCEILAGTDACFAPVVPLAEAVRHPQIRARGIYVEQDGKDQPAPVPRFSRTPGAIQPEGVGVDMLRRWIEGGPR